MNRDTREKLSTTTIALHWLVGLIMLGLLASGVFMVEAEYFPLYPLHKAIGVLIMIAVVLRVLWRAINRWPEHVSEYTPTEKLLSKVVHYLLLIGTVIMPISGFIMSTAGGYGVDVFGLELTARNPDPADPKSVIPLNESLAGFAKMMHTYAGYAVIAGVVLHILGAYKHHLIDKDSTMRRMLGARVG